MQLLLLSLWPVEAMTAQSQEQAPRSSTRSGPVSAPAEPQEEVELVEEIEIVDVVSVEPVATASTSGGMGVSTVVGRFHPALVHLPLAGVVLLALFELLRLGRWGEGLGKASLLLLGFTVLTALPAVASGLLRAAELAGKGARLSQLPAHRAVMLSAVGLAVLALAIRVLKGRNLAGVSRWIYLILVLGAAALVPLGGHLGGKLVYGDNFLPF